MVAAAITRGEVLLDNVRLDHMTAVIEKLHEMGVRVEETPVGVRVTVPGELQASDCIMLPYPGLPTDVQAQFMALLATIPGISIITEKVFPDRFLHLAELIRLGARIRREGASAIINGVPQLSGACVMASDLRASAALVLAGLASKGQTVVRRIYHLDRGYDRLEDKLNSLGARITRVQDTPANLPDSLSLSPTAAPWQPAEEPREVELRGPRWLRSKDGVKLHQPEESV